MKKIIVVSAVGLALLTAAPALAIFGPMPVIDLDAIKKLADQVQNEEHQLEQVRNMAQMAKSNLSSLASGSLADKLGTVRSILGEVDADPSHPAYAASDAAGKASEASAATAQALAGQAASASGANQQAQVASGYAAAQLDESQKQTELQKDAMKQSLSDAAAAGGALYDASGNVKLGDNSL